MEKECIEVDTTTNRMRRELSFKEEVRESIDIHGRCDAL